MNPNRMTLGRTFAIIAVLSALAACQTAQYEESAKATAALKATKGNKAYGEVTFEQVGDKVRVAVKAVNVLLLKD